MLTLAGSGIILGVLANSAGDLQKFWAGFREKYLSSETHPAVPAPGELWSRIDISDQFVKLTGIPVSSGQAFLFGVSLLLLLAGFCFYWSHGRPKKVAMLSPMQALLACGVLLSVYHCHYDFAFLAPFWLAAWFSWDQSWRKLSTTWRWFIALTLTIPFGNHAIDFIGDHWTYLSMPWRIGITINSVATTLAGGCLLLLLFRQRANQRNEALS